MLVFPVISLLGWRFQVTAGRPGRQPGRRGVPPEPDAEPTEARHPHETLKTLGLGLSSGLPARQSFSFGQKQSKNGLAS